MVGRQTPFLALFLPFMLVFMVDGRRGVRAIWPAALAAGLTFALLQFVMSNYISMELTDIVASLGAAGVLVAFMRVWHPSAPGAPAATARGRHRPAIAGGSASDAAFERDVRARSADGGPPPSRKDMILAFAPYLIIVVILGIMSLHTVLNSLDTSTTKFSWPGLHVLTAKGKPPTSEIFKLNWFTAAGTGLLASGILTAVVLRVNPLLSLRIYWKTIVQIRWALVTVMAVLALAYVMNMSAQTITLGTWAAGAGGFFAFLSPLIGWFGTAVTGSDTSTNSLFGALQVAAANKSGLSPTLLAAANSSGGVLAKMVSPQNLAIGAAAVGLAGKEGDIFRKVIGWSVVLVLAMAVLVLLQSGPLSFMVP
jgi:lactate permease